MYISLSWFLVFVAFVFVYKVFRLRDLVYETLFYEISVYIFMFVIMIAVS